MTTAVDEGGKPPCWAHLYESPIDDIEDSGDVERIVRDFCRQATTDDLLGPVFAAAGIMRNAHIETLVESWSWQLFGVRGYVGNPLRAYCRAGEGSGAQDGGCNGPSAGRRVGRRRRNRRSGLAGCR